MDTSEVKKKKILINRKQNKDGSISFTVKKKPKKKKVIKAQGYGEHTVGNVIASQLIPFRKPMEKALSKRGFNISGIPFKEVIPLYYNEFVSNKENSASPFVPVNSFEFRNNPVWKIKPSHELNGTFHDFRNRDYFVQVSGIVDNIISVFAASKAKKQQAIAEGVSPKVALTVEEYNQATAAENIEKQLEAKVTDSEAVRWGSIKKIIIWVAIVFAIYYILK